MSEPTPSLTLSAKKPIEMGGVKIQGALPALECQQDTSRGTFSMC